MLAQVPLWPERGSTHAGDVDGVMIFLIALTVFFTLLIGTLVISFAVKYRRRHENEVPNPTPTSYKLELTWTIVPLCIVIIAFVWGTRVYFRMASAPDDAMEIYVVGKQWMWHIQHLGGQRENQMLHIPVGRPIKLIMTSQDVIHNVSIPAFRLKQDVIPGRYSVLSFTAAKPGKYHLFCGEYCGTEHSRMVGWVIAMEPAGFEKWLNSPLVDGSLAWRGRKHFQRLGCVSCHAVDATARGPNLEGLFGRKRPLTSGTVVDVDESYLRRSILVPDADIVPGFRPIMPSFKGQLDEIEMLELIGFLRELGPGQTPMRVEAADALNLPPPETKNP